MDEALAEQSQKALIYPIFCGTALKGEGILPLLTGILRYLPAPLDLDHEPVSGIVYNISHHKTLGKLSHIRLFSGKISCRDEILNVTTNTREKVTLIKKIIGMIQQEILHSILKERFNLNVSFSKPSVIYKETPSGSGYGTEHYTMPKPCWAIVEFAISPLPLGSGVVYESKVRTEDVKLKYQREIKNNLMHILKQGLYGWQVTDLKIVLENGSDHVMHSRPGDFAAATAMGLMKGFNEIGMTLLEPLITFHISVPEDLGGKVLNDIIQMRGTLSTQFHGYQPCPFDLGATRERIGVNPLNRSKYILYVRNAL